MSAFNNFIQENFRIMRVPTIWELDLLPEEVLHWGKLWALTAIIFMAPAFGS